MSKFKKFLMVFGLIFAIIFTFSLVCAAGQEAIVLYHASSSHDKIKENYIPTTEDYIYISDEEIKEDSVNLINNMMSRIPSVLSEEIKEKWIILVSDSPVCNGHEHVNPAGMTDYNKRVVWLKIGFSEEVLAHEMGHIFGDMLGSIEYSKDFCDFYETYRCKYIEYGKDKVNEYTASNSVEFFALLFKEYVCHPDYLKENFEEGYNCILNKVNSLWRTGSWGNLMSNLVRIYNTISFDVRSASASLSVIPDVFTIETKVSNNPKIDVTQYESIISYAGMSSESIAVVEEMLDVINNPEKCGNKAVVTIKHSGYITLASYQEIYSFFDFYFGNEKSEFFDVSANRTKKESFIYIDIKKALELKENLELCMEKIDAALGEMHEGTETEKLLQISKFIHKNCSYELRGRISVSEFWEEGKGDCLTYAMMFRLFCQRIGIECDIIIGNTGVMAHSWNRVKLSDGSYRYYDLICYNLLKLDMSNYKVTNVVYVNNYVWN